MNTNGLFLIISFQFDQEPKLKSSARSNDITCIEKGYHWLGGHEELETDSPKFDVKSDEECQELCQKNPQCKWFNWNESTFPNVCYLLKKKGTKKNSRDGRKKGSTGPKRCPSDGNC